MPPHQIGPKEREVMKKKREVEGISLSFLDVISCGFGAIIILLVLTKIFEPVIIDATVSNLEGYLADLQEELVELRGEVKKISYTGTINHIIS